MNRVKTNAAQMPIKTPVMDSKDLVDNHQQNIRSCSSKRHASPDFSGPLSHGVCNNAMDADQSHQQGDACDEYQVTSNFADAAMV
ncbi:MAG TPA: hypothetical protein VK638_00800, partial [Edaphobacter sp.]|nr:hypothetical protein [Edaphobacter sp.]